MSRTESAAVLASRLHLDAALRRARRSPVPTVLCYHRIGDATDSPYDRAGWDATAEELDRQLAELARGYDVVGPEECGLAGARRRVMITFDDGYRDNHDIALPLLQQHGLPATFFVTTGFLDDRRVSWWDEIAWMVHNAQMDAFEIEGDQLIKGEAAIQTLLARYKTLSGDATAQLVDAVAQATGSGRHPRENDVWMNWDMVRAMRDAGMTIGGHSATHPILARLSASGQQQEVDACAQRLEDELGLPMRWFSYPVGLPDAFDNDTRSALLEHGVELAFSLYGATRASWDPYDVRRCSVGRVGQARFRMMLVAPELFARA